MNRLKKLAAAVMLASMLVGCSTTQSNPDHSSPYPQGGEAPADTVEIGLSDEAITVNGVAADTSVENAVYIGNDIVYYEAGKDFTYGEGTEADAHSPEAAAEHTVVHITQPGTYSISGSLSKGQIAVDLGKNAEEDPNAVVTLILNGTDITCEVAPAVIFYRVYECGSDDTQSASKDVDTSAAGANVVVADGTINTINGSYVARIYKPDSVVLNQAGTEVEDAKKLHKYDGAFYSRMSMNVNGGKENTGVLTINAENEGMDSECHLTINGGIIRIHSGNDGINTNEDGVSVTTINGGDLHIRVTGETGEGDGIDSNGWLVINGGVITAQACSFSADAGIDSDMGIHINGGTVLATGHMLDRIEDGGQNYAVFSFAQEQHGGNAILMKNKSGDSVLEATPENDYSMLIFSGPDLTEGVYTLWCDDVQMSGQSGNMMGKPGMPGMPAMPDVPGDANFAEPPEWQGTEEMMPPAPPEGMWEGDGKQPFDGPKPPEGMGHPAGGTENFRPDGKWNPNDRTEGTQQDSTLEFQISRGGNMFQVN